MLQKLEPIKCLSCAPPIFIDKKHSLIQEKEKRAKDEEYHVQRKTKTTHNVFHLTTRIN
jgi:hypothetical protein